MTESFNTIASLTLEASRYQAEHIEALMCAYWIQTGALPELVTIQDWDGTQRARVREAQDVAPELVKAAESHREHAEEMARRYTWNTRIPPASCEVLTTMCAAGLYIGFQEWSEEIGQ